MLLEPTTKCMLGIKCELNGGFGDWWIEKEMEMVNEKV
jgi:hypothetical protein